MKLIIPSCSGSHDYWGEFDCDSIHERTCEECLCNYEKLGGLWNPETGHKWKESSAEKAISKKEINNGQVIFK